MCNRCYYHHILKYFIISNKNILTTNQKIFLSFFHILCKMHISPQKVFSKYTFRKNAQFEIQREGSPEIITVNSL